MIIPFSCIVEITTTQPGIGCQLINHFALNVIVLVGVVSADTFQQWNTISNPVI
jgi:hypothetical protein